jgi:tripeptide aminopeptidase
MKALLIAITLFLPPGEQHSEPRQHETVVQRFLRYVQLDTQSKDDVKDIPTTAHQFVLARLLAGELRALGLSDAGVDDHCFVTATLPSNLPPDEAIRVPIIGLISHLDTSPAASGSAVHPIVHRNYAGEDIIFPGDTTLVLSSSGNRHLQQAIGNDLITADGMTLLGADDKAGVAEIMTVVQTLIEHPRIKHGTVKIAFTPDEETGTSIGTFDVKRFGAAYAYTIDGETLGQINEESWNADQATLTVRGKSAHPGTAKGQMVSSLYALSAFLSRLPPEVRPEATDGRQGFIHPDHGTLSVEESEVKLSLRDFDLAGLERQHALLLRMRDSVAAAFPGTTLELAFTREYRNMKLVLDSVPLVTSLALEACRRSGIEPELVPVRGGTDGSDLTFMGLPCPNIFVGGDNFHSRLEWVSVAAMDKSVDVIINLLQLWKEHHR